ncbi:MAG: TolC family protein [Bryobacterales bacterium]|nr:TolC family protein [Bryobacterales bacterium]
MRSTIRFAYLCGWAVWACYAQAPPLTLAECRRLAESVPSAVSVAQLEARIASTGVRVARSAFLPQAALASGYTYNSPLAGQQSFIALNGIREYQALAGAALELDTSGRLRASLARARADHAIANENAVIARRDLRRAVAAAYYGLLLSRHLASAAATSLNEASDFLERTRALYAGGEVARADVVKAESQVAFLEQTSIAAGMAAELANQELASFWTAGTAARLEIVDSLVTPEPPPSTGEGAYLARPEFRLFTFERQGFEADARRERGALYPQVNLVYQYGLDSLRVRAADRGSAVFLTMNVPIFDWFRARDTARQFRLRAEQANATRTAAGRVFSQQYSAAATRLRLLWRQISATRTQIATSEENLKLTRARYVGGEGPALDVVAAQQQLQQARVNYYTALADYANAGEDLEVASGR